MFDADIKRCLDIVTFGVVLEISERQCEEMRAFYDVMVAKVAGFTCLKGARRRRGYDATLTELMMAILTNLKTHILS